MAKTVLRGLKRKAAEKQTGQRDGRTKFVVHPLFLIAGIFSSFTGNLFAFFSAGIAAALHELAHALAAKRYGFTLDKIVLMPYGAVISGDISGISRKQEFAVCVAGPLVNFATALFFVALWWVYPETYPFTQTAVDVSFSLFLLNLLPAYPLDGGRILNLFLRPLGEKRAQIVRVSITLTFCAAIFGYFVFTCFSSPAFSALFFSVFLGMGAFGGGKYNRLHFSRKKNFNRGLEEQRIAISAERTLGYALRFLREDRYLIFVLYEGEEFLGELSEREYLEAFEKGDSQAKLGDCLAGFFEKGA